MPVTKGQYTVGLKQGGITIPDIKSPLETVAEGAQSIAKTFFDVAVKKQEVNFINSFTNDVSKNYEKFNNDYKYDPVKMREQVENYGKVKLQNIPLAFKEYATKYLASKNATAITYATNNKIKLDDENLKIGAEINKVNFNNNLNTNIDVILSQPGVPANIKANNVLLNFNDKDADIINNHYGQLFQADPLNKSTHYKDYQSTIEETSAVLLASKMRAYNDSSRAFKESEKFLKDGKLFSNIKDLELKNTSADIEQYSGNLANRSKIAKKALEYYAATRSKTIDQLRTDSKTETNLKIKAAQNFEPGSVSHMGTIKNTITNYSNINELADNLFPDATSAQMTDTIIPLLNDNQKRYNLVKDVINQKTNAISNLEEKDKNQLTNDLLAYYNINDINVLSDPNNKDAATVVDLISKLNYLPSKVKSFLSTDGFNYQSENFKNDFINKSYVYKRLSEKGGIDLGEDSGLYEVAESGAWETLGNKELSDRILNWKNNKKPINETIDKINKSLTDNEDKFDDLIKSELTDMEGPKWFGTVAGKFVLDEVLSKVGLGNIIETRGEKEQKLGVDIISPSNVNILPRPFVNYSYNPETIAKVKELTKQNFANLNPTSTNLDITHEDNKEFFDIALRKTIKQLKQQKYGFTKHGANYNLDNKVSYEKNAFELHHPEISLKEIQLETLANINVWASSIDKKELPQYLGSDLNGNPYSLKDIRGHILTNDNAIILRPVRGTKDDLGRPRFSLAIKNPNGEIIQISKENEYFSASDSWSRIPNTNLPATMDNIKVFAAKEALNNFKEKYSHLINKDNEKLISKAFYGWEKFRISAANFSLDISDIPFKKYDLEIQPFKYLFNLLGVDVDVEKERTNLIKIERQYLDAIKTSDKILMSSKGNDLEKKLESIYPPNLLPYTEYSENMRFKNYVENNYNNSSLPLGIRTNNYIGITKNVNANYNGQLDIDYNNNVLFARPSDSYHAGILSILNKSTISKNNVEKQYGDNPTFEEVVKSFGSSNKVYNIAENNFGWDKNTPINLLKFNDVKDLMLILTLDNIGEKEFEKYYGDNKLLVNRFIKDAFDRAKQYIDLE